MDNIVKIGNISIGHGFPLVLISGPCVIENYERTNTIVSFLKDGKTFWSVFYNAVCKGP